ncbi:ComEC/Rec2 family competence protein [Tamlana fucoidanivorans]|uniref:ComEC/Rec2 family competence protein n=1 Tax=Allotamlana fucoidanivorans TaxID=2583814 RepID=UPI0038916C39
MSLTFSCLVALFVSYSIAKKQFTKTIWFGLLAFVTMTSIGLLTATLHNQRNVSNHYTHYISIKEDSLYRLTFKVKEILKPDTYNHKYIVELIDLDHNHVLGKSLLNLKKDTLTTPVFVDDIFISYTNLHPLKSPLNPYQFDYRNYLNKKYIYHQLFCNEAALFQVQSDSKTLLGHANNIRNFINKKLSLYHFKANELAIINALFLGQRQDISKETYANYAKAGAIHILAVSGLHVGIILMILNFIFKPLERFRHGRFIKTVFILFLLWCFAFIAGLSPSVTRAVTMFSIVAIAMNLKRATNIYNTLAISMFIILLFKPLYVFDVGFQLSYLAVFAIVTIDPWLYGLWRPKYKLVLLYWHTLTVTIAAQIGILPISLYYFHQFPGLFFISNLIIIPILGLILGFGLFIILLASFNLLPQWIATCFAHVIDFMNRAVGWIAHQESFLFEAISFNLLHVFFAYLIIIALTRLLIKRTFRSVYFILASVLIIQSFLIFEKLNFKPDEFVIFHKRKSSILGYTNKDSLLISHNADGVSFSNTKIVEQYMIGKHLKYSKNIPFKAVYRLKDKFLLRVDSMGIYQVKSFRPNQVLLMQSPKINLSRLIDSIQPQQIIADGSNYKSYIKRWKVTCKKRNIPFHSTSQQGAFIFPLK